MAESNTKATDAKNGEEENKYGLEPAIEAQLREVFKVFDDSDDGKIDSKELGQILEAITG